MAGHLNGKGSELFHCSCISSSLVLEVDRSPIDHLEEVDYVNRSITLVPLIKALC